MKLAAHNSLTTIDEGLVARHNHAEQSAWAAFKHPLFIQRSELIVPDLASLENSFSLYSDTDYLKERFLKLAPAIRYQWYQWPSAFLSRHSFRSCAQSDALL